MSIYLALLSVYYFCLLHSSIFEGNEIGNNESAWSDPTL